MKFLWASDLTKIKFNKKKSQKIIIITHNFWHNKLTHQAIVTVDYLRTCWIDINIINVDFLKWWNRENIYVDIRKYPDTDNN